MAKRPILAITLVLQCLFQWCSPAQQSNNIYTFKSFKRWDKNDSFLKIEWDERKSAYNLSFTGLKNDSRAKFKIFKNSLTFQIRPADMADYILGVEGGSLAVKYLPNETTDPKYNFWQRRIIFNYSEGGNKMMSEKYRIIQSEVQPHRVIKSSRSGRVSLSVNWKTCGSWLEMKKSN